MKYIIIAIAFICSLSCTNYAQNSKSNEVKERVVDESGYSVAVFAQGCFWCVEEIFESIVGVEGVISGYCGGEIENPTYKQVGSGATKHAEAVKVLYDPNVVSYEELLKVYFNSGDISQVNGQGNDRGPQYRSIVFYSDDNEKDLVNKYIERLNTFTNSSVIAVEVLPLADFYDAEDYHQNFVKLNPDHGYVKAVSVPRYKKAIQEFPELLK